MKDATVAQVFATKDYNRFKRVAENRNVTKDRKDKLVASFQQGELLCPIIVNKKWEIIDGQGRYEALKELGRPIKYIVEASAGIDDCRRMNHYNKPWTTQDFIASYAESGNENYIRLAKVCNEEKLSYTRAVYFAHIYASNISRKIQSGNLDFTEKNEEEVKAINRELNELKKALCMESAAPDTLARAMSVIHRAKGYDHKRMVTKATEQRHTFKAMSDLTSMLAEMSRIYNYKSRGDKIFFEDYMRDKGKNVRNYDDLYEKGLGKLRDDTDISTLKEA